jgi:hypothetical protein
MEGCAQFRREINSLQVAHREDINAKKKEKFKMAPMKIISGQREDNS